MSLTSRPHVLPSFKAMARLAVIFVITFAFHRAALAKGPVSVTISGPGINPPLELMSGDNFDLITALMEQTGLWYAIGDLPARMDEPSGDLGPSYTLTWINAGPPDIAVQERTILQLIYPQAKSGILIHTPPQDSLANWGPEVIGWSTAPDGLMNTLDELGAALPASAGKAGFSGPAGGSLLERLAAGDLAYPGLLAFAFVIALAAALFAYSLKNRPGAS